MAYQITMFKLKYPHFEVLHMLFKLLLLHELGS